MLKMVQWYERDAYLKKRLLSEVDYVNDYAVKFPKSEIGYLLSDCNKSFIVKYITEYNGKYFGVWCTYPVMYPKVRIKVELFELDIKRREIVRFDEGYHNSNGVLCLLLHYPNQWKEEYGIAYIIERVNAWFLEGQYDSKNIVPTHFNIDNELFILPEPLCANYENLYGTFDYYRINESLCYITAISTPKKTIETEEIPNSFINDRLKTESGIIVFTSKSVNNIDLLKFSDVKSYLNCFNHGVKGLLDFAMRKGIGLPVPIIIANKNIETGGLACYLSFDGKSYDVKSCRFNYFRIYNDIFSRVKDHDEITYLRKKKIGLIGLGALGSVIAAELTRSGIGNFVLIDFDKLEVQNIGRHDLTLKDLDKYKVYAVKEKIQDINPLAKCECYNFDVLDDYSFNLYNLLSCDLVVSTLDNQEAKYAIDSTLISDGKKVVYAGVFYNSIASYVIVSDRRMACFQCASNHMDIMAEKKEIPDFSAMVPKHETITCGMPTFPGGSINTHTAALFTSRIVLNTLLGKREMDESGYPYNMFLIGLEKVLIDEEVFFEGYMDVKKYILSGNSGCPICDNVAQMNEIEDGKFNVIMEQMRK